MSVSDLTSEYEKLKENYADLEEENEILTRTTKSLLDVLAGKSRTFTNAEDMVDSIFSYVQLKRANEDLSEMVRALSEQVKLYKSLNRAMKLGEYNDESI